MTRLELKTIVRDNLADNGLGTYYQETEVEDSLQDAYDDIVMRSRCIIKNFTQNWLSGVNYYDFVSLGVADFMGAFAIFNRATNQWLRDDLSLRDLDRLRKDWELWQGQPQFWVPHSLKYTVVSPRLAVGTGQFTVWYWGMAPQFVDDTSIPLVATDMQTLFEYYCTADLLETAEESAKAIGYWKQYEDGIKSYSNRCKDLAASNLLRRI